MSEPPGVGSTATALTTANLSWRSEVADEGIALTDPEFKKAERRCKNKEYQRRYRQIHKDRIKKQNSEYTKRNRAKVNARTRAWYAANPDKARERALRKRQKNREYDKARARARRAANPDLDREYSRRAAVKRRYGISWRDREAMVVAQNYRCAICSKDLSRRSDINLDHCHKTGKIRAILCRTCNTGIAMMKEDTRIMEAAIEYLKRHQGDGE